LYFSVIVLCSFRPWVTSTPAHIFVSSYFNPARCLYFCLSHSNLQLYLPF
jgi:hypothetical protein